jgi:hypothetical protein
MASSFFVRTRTLLLWVVTGAVSGLVSFLFDQSLNLMVFRQASHDLLAGDDLYVRRAQDYFKYSPTFALLFEPIAALPPWLSAVVWSALNFGVAWAGLWAFVDDPKKRERAVLFALVGVVIATDGDQSNLLVLGVSLLALRALSEGRGNVFAALLAVGAAIKLFPLLCALAILLYPRKLANAARLAVAGAVLLVLPLLVTSLHALVRDYASWHALLSWDHDNTGWSVMSLLQKGAGVTASNGSLQVMCLLALALPLVPALRFGVDAAFKRTFVASVLVFSVIANHRAEYATYVIFAGAVAAWWSVAKVNVARTTLVILAFVCVGPFFTRANEVPTGILSVLGAHRLFHPLRVLPPLCCWLWMQRDLYAHFIRVTVELRERHAS